MLPLSRNYTHLQPEDRATLASLRQQNFSIRAIARLLDCSTARPAPSAASCSATPLQAPTPAQARS